MYDYQNAQNLSDRQASPMGKFLLVIADLELKVLYYSEERGGFMGRQWCLSALDRRERWSE